MGEAVNDETQIRKMIDNWAQAVRGRDFEQVLSRHSKDIVLFDVPPPVQSRGIDAYRESWELFFRSMPAPVVFDLSELSITAGNDVAFAHGLIRCQALEGGQTVDLGIRLTVGLRKLDGEWTVMHEHHSEPAA